MISISIFSLPFNQSGYAFLLFFAGLISIINGFSLIFDNRKLNQYLSSTLLINNGLMLIFDGFYRLGHYKFGYIKITTLVIQVFISFLSLLLVSYHHEQNGHIAKREKGSGWGFFRFKKPTRRE
jgi:hypothetical protein